MTGGCDQRRHGRYRQVVNTKHSGHGTYLHDSMPSKTFDLQPVAVWSKCVGVWSVQNGNPIGSIVAFQVVNRHNSETLVMENVFYPWWSALLAIVLIDLVLAGDNAIVIALRPRSRPPLCRRKPSSGALGAIVSDRP